MRNSIGKIDTNTLLLVAAAGVGVYLFTKPKAAAVNPYVNPLTGLPYNYGSSTQPVLAANNPANQGTSGAIISAAGGVLSSVFDTLFG